MTPLRPEVVSAYQALFRKAGRDDKTVDGVELEAARAALPEASSDEVREAIVRVFVEDGIELSGRALTMALHDAGEDVGWRFGTSENDFHRGNGALRDLDQLLHTNFLEAHGPLGPSPPSVGELSRLVRDALVRAKHPKAVSAYLHDLFRRAHESLEGRSGRVDQARQVLDQVRAQFKLDGPRPKGMHLHPSELEAMRTAPKSTLAWYNSVYDDFSPRLEGFSSSGEPRKDLVGLLNDVIADGALSAADVATLQTHFDRTAPKPARSWSWFNRTAPLPPRAVYNRADLHSFSEALKALPPEIASAAHKDQLLAWIAALEAEGRVYDEERGRASQLSSLELPSSATKDPGPGPILEHEYDYAAALAPEARKRIWETRSLSRPEDRLRELAKFALGAMRELQTLGRQVTVDGKTYLASEGAETRRVGHASFHAESTFGVESERQQSKHLLWGLIGTVKDSHTREGGSSTMDGNAEAHQIVGRCYDLSPAISGLSGSEQQRVAEAYRAQIAPSLAAIQESLSRIIDNLVDLELTGPTAPAIPEVIREMIAWARSTSYRASYASSEYLGPSRGSRAVNIEVMHHWVLDRLLGDNN